MRITCPACTVAYEVPDRLLQPGRSVKCAQCGHLWQPGAAAEMPGAPPEPAIAPESKTESKLEPDIESEPESALSPPVEEPAAPEEIRTPAFQLPGVRREAGLRPEPEPEPEVAPPVQRAGIAGWLPWVASVLLVLIAVAAAVHWRTPLMHAWPASERVFASLGLVERAP